MNTSMAGLEDARPVCFKENCMYVISNKDFYHENYVLE